MPTFNTTETTKARSILFECVVLQFILLQENMRQRCEDTENMLAYMYRHQTKGPIRPRVNEYSWLIIDTIPRVKFEVMYLTVALILGTSRFST